MNKTLKKAWIKDLRGGKIEQATGALCNLQGGMCCLGVLADIAIDGDWVPYGGLYQLVSGNDVMTGALPAPAQFGISLRQQNTLIGLNDDQGKSFAEIADWIEENL